MLEPDALRTTSADGAEKMREPMRLISDIASRPASNDCNSIQYLVAPPDYPPVIPVYLDTLVSTLRYV